MRIKRFIHRLFEFGARLKKEFYRLSRLRKLASIFAAGGVILGILIPFFPDGSHLYLWLSDIFIIIFSIHLWEGRGDKKILKTKWRKVELLILILILSLALFLRSYRLYDIPRAVYSGESQHIIWQATSVKEHGLKSPFDGLTDGRVRIGSYHLLPLMLIFNNNILAPRVTHALFGTFFVFLMFLFVKRCFNSRIALLAAFFLAVCVLPVAYSRYGIYWPVELTWALASIYFLAKAIDNNRKIDFVLSGIFVGVSMTYGHYMFFCVPLIAAGFILYQMFVTKRISRKEFANIGLLILFASVVFYPRLYDIIFVEKEMVAVRTFIHPFSNIGGTGQPAFLLNIKDMFLSFFYKAPYEDQFTLIPEHPVFDRTTAIFFVIGLVSSLIRLRRSQYHFLIVLIFVAVCIPPILSKAFLTHRVWAMPLAVFSLAAIGMDFIWRRLEGRWKKNKQVILIGAILILVYIAGINFHGYFRLYADSKKLWTGFSRDVYYYTVVENNAYKRNKAKTGARGYYALRVAKQMARQDLANQNYLISDKFTHRIIFPLTHGIVSYNRIIDFREMPIKGKIENDLTFYIVKEIPWLFPWQVYEGEAFSMFELLKHYYPNGIQQELKDDWGQVYGYKYMVSREEAREVSKTAVPYIEHGLTGNYYATVNKRKTLLFTRVDSIISLENQSAIPKSVSNVEWTGKINIPNAGDYGFMLCSRGQATLRIDGVTIIEFDSRKAREVFSERQSVSLGKGRHKIRIEYFPEHPATITLLWTKPGSNREELVPLTMLYPE